MATLSAYEKNNVIELKVSQPSVYLEGEHDLGVSLYPGHIVRWPGTFWSVAPSDDYATLPIVIVENPQEGKTIYDGFAAGERMKMRVCRRGDFVLLRYTDVGVTVGNGGLLATDANTGGVKLWDGVSPGAVIANAEETIATPATVTLLKVMIW